MSQWITAAQPFLQYIDQWFNNLPAPKLAQVAAPPSATAIVSVDVINGFCYQGPLASERVRRIIEPIVGLFQRAWDLGVRHILLTQDTPDPQAKEFAQFPPHCVRGTEEAEPVPEFKALPFFDQMVQIAKNSIHSGLNTGLQDWIEAHPQVGTFIVVGDCTDLCTYQLAMHLRLEANARQLDRRVVVPANCVETYHMAVETARELGAVPHEGDLLHRIFLYHMMLNGIEVVAALS